MAKALTLKQPWAELVVLGAKWIETRPFGTDYRGPLYIHSSGHFHFSDLELCYQIPEFNKHIPTPHSQCRPGEIVGMAQLNDIKKMDEHLVEEFFQTDQRVFGEWKEGRYAWFLSHAVKFGNPIKMKGQLGPWDFDDTEFEFMPVNKVLEANWPSIGDSVMVFIDRGSKQEWVDSYVTHKYVDCVKVRMAWGEERLVTDPNHLSVNVPLKEEKEAQHG
jgi:hypothetical protein